MKNWRAWVLAMMTMNIIGFGFSWTVNTHAAQRADAAAARAVAAAEKEREQRAEAGRQIVCTLVVAQDDVYLAEPPASDTGKKAAAAWHYLREQYRC